MVVLFKCKCGYPLVIDEGESVRVMMRHWRLNKKTGIVQANCEECNARFHLGEGNSIEGVETHKPMPNILFSVGAV